MINRRKIKRLDPNTVVLIKQIAYGLLAITAAALLLVGIWHGARINSLTLETVLVSGGETIKHSEIEAKVLAELQGEYMGFIPKSFSWLYPKNTIVEQLETVNRIHSINVEKVSGKKLKVTFDEYVPHALWCNHVNDQNCAFLDENGFAFAKAPNLTGGSLLRLIEIGSEYKLRESVIEKADYVYLHKITDLLAEKGWFVSLIEFDNAGDAFLRVTGGGEFKITLSQTPEETVDNLFVVLSSEDFNHIKPGNFQYIDLRFGEKVYVNEELDPVVVESGTADMETPGDTEEAEVE